MFGISKWRCGLLGLFRQHVSPQNTKILRIAYGLQFCAGVIEFQLGAPVFGRGGSGRVGMGERNGIGSGSCNGYRRGSDNVNGSGNGHDSGNGAGAGECNRKRKR